MKAYTDAEIDATDNSYDASLVLADTKQKLTTVQIGKLEYIRDNGHRPEGE